MLIKPSKESINNFLFELKKNIKTNISLKTNELIYLLNPKITGWCNYYKTVVSSKVFSKIDNRLYQMLNSWINRKHSNKGSRWKYKKYFTKLNLCNWRFYPEIKDKDGYKRPLYLKRASETKIRRHIKICGAANPFNSEYKKYFQTLERRHNSIKNGVLLGSFILPY